MGVSAVIDSNAVTGSTAARAISISCILYSILGWRVSRGPISEEYGSCLPAAPRAIIAVRSEVSSGRLLCRPSNSVVYLGRCLTLT